jgi:hypothetical protein
MAKVGPSIQRGYETAVEKKSWDDIGGLEEVKKVLLFLLRMSMS